MRARKVEKRMQARTTEERDRSWKLLQWSSECGRTTHTHTHTREFSLTRRQVQSLLHTEVLFWTSTFCLSSPSALRGALTSLPASPCLEPPQKKKPLWVAKKGSLLRTRILVLVCVLSDILQIECNHLVLIWGLIRRESSRAATWAARQAARQNYHRNETSYLEEQHF